LVDLGTFHNGTNSVGSGISSNGEWLVGSSDVQPENYPPGYFPDTRQGFFVQGTGTMTSVSGLYNPGDFNHRFAPSEIYGVNDLGAVVGYCPTLRANYYHAIFWQPGMSQALDLAATGGGDPSYSRAFDINNAGDIVGYLADDTDLFKYS